MSETKPKETSQQLIRVLGWLGIVLVSLVAGCLGAIGAYFGTIAFLNTFFSDIGQAGIFFLPVLLCTPILGFLALGGIAGLLLRLLWSALDRSVPGRMDSQQCTAAKNPDGPS